MRYKELILGDKVIKSQRSIDSILTENGINWLIDSEIEDAVIEIKNKTLIWHSGTYYYGDWYYGIFKEGIFWGNFINGIFENGVFKGKWCSSINLQILNKDIKN